jgi:flavin reductase (DIM6/NTAB) family NADH-FMN oxidoreductase RutF
VSDIDHRTFRFAAGQFATGVTIVTTLDEDDLPAGLTANSFTSVSLEPPLLSFCLGRDSDTALAFAAGNGFAVHVLAAEQQDLAIRFSSKGIDRFEGVGWSPGVTGVPVIDGALATFECEVAAAYDGGDHVIYVGRVLEVFTLDTDRPSLGYLRGRYIALSRPG